MIIVAVAVGVPLLVLAVVSPLAFIGGRKIRSASNFTSLTFSHLVDFALAKEDRTDAIGQFFEWKHTVHLELLKTVVGFLLSNLGLLITFAVKPNDESVQIFRLATHLDLTAVLVIGAVGTVVVIGWLLLRIRRIPREYSIAVRVLGLLR